MARGNENEHFQCITAMECYKEFSVEELRVACYQYELTGPKTLVVSKHPDNGSQIEAMRKTVEI